MLGKVINSYLSHFLQLLKAMQEVIVQGDIPAVQMAAHTLKSSSATLGAVGIVVQCKELELIARAGSLDGADAHLTELEIEYGPVQVAFTAQLKRIGS